MVAHCPEQCVGDHHLKTHKSPAAGKEKEKEDCYTVLLCFATRNFCFKSVCIFELDHFVLTLHCCKAGQSTHPCRALLTPLRHCLMPHAGCALQCGKRSPQQQYQQMESEVDSSSTFGQMGTFPDVGHQTKKIMKSMNGSAGPWLLCQTVEVRQQCIKTGLVQLMGRTNSPGLTSWTRFPKLNQMCWLVWGCYILDQFLCWCLFA